MNNRRCSNCYFGDKCRSNQACEDYSPIIDEPTDAEVEKMIEDGRETFYEAWNEYISEYED